MRTLRLVSPAARRHEVADGAPAAAPAPAPAPADVLPYLLHLPEAYDADPDRAWPLVLFLHGAGERGSDLDLVTTQGLPKLAAEGREFPFVLASPQCPAASQWVPEVTTLAGLLDEVTAGFRIDPTRVYATGFSMGGFGTWSLAVRYPDRFAAIAPICGGLWSQGVDPLRTLPIWTFHGEDDDTVPISFTEDIVTALHALDANVRFTRYPSTAHDAWTRTYAEPSFYTWLLTQRRPD